MRNQSKKDTKRAAIIKDTADIAEVSTRSVQRVLNGVQENETVLSVFMELDERYDEVFKEVRNWATIFNRSPKPATN